MFFKPNYKKRGKLLLKGVRKFLNYKKDVIRPELLTEIEGMRDELEDAIKEDDKDTIQTVSKKLTRVCEKSVPQQSFSGLRENIEVIFVAVVIAVGIRTYFLQPFKIPTGSMQVTLNGVIAYNVDVEPPGMMTRVWERVTRGRRYFDVKSPYTGTVVFGPNFLTESSSLFSTKSILTFSDGRQVTFPVPKNRILDLGLGEALNMRPDRKGNWNQTSGDVEITEGQTLIEGYVESGDQVLVDKVSYHFRSPRRGEVFVFNTRGIRGIETRNTFREEWGSQHYIKRLVGVPGDRIEVDPPRLLVNGKEAEEIGIRRVWEEMGDKGEYGGYVYGDGPSHDKVELEATPDKVSIWPAIREGEDIYWAMGDNSAGSSDSRAWGAVPERNLVGPALFVYWPFAQHWGFIE